MKKQLTLGFWSCLISALFVVCVWAQEQEDGEEADSAPVDMSSDGSDDRLSQVQMYSIRGGDTMWDICKIVLDNPWYWPKLWSLNQYILNPNLIYPGHKLAFSPGTDTTFPKLEVVGVEEVQNEAPIDEEEDSIFKEAPEKPVVSQAPNRMDFIITANKTPGSLSVKLRPISFITPKELNTVGKIRHSGEPKMLLNFGDKVYLDFYKKMNLKVGDKFQVIENVKRVFDPDRETKKIGWMIRKKAEMTVTHISNEASWRRRIVEAVISDADDSALRGDEFIPYKEDVVSVVPHFTDKEIYGKIVEADAEQFLISNNDFVFLNIGKKDGLQPGLQLYVVRTGDGLLPEEGQDLPDVPVAKILVVDSYEKTSTAYVTTLDRPLSVGDRVRSHIE